MSKEKRRVPKLRFPGFTEDWEQRKFGDLFEYERPDAYIVKSDNYNNDFNMPVLTANKAFILGYTNEENSYNKPSIIFDDFTLDRKYVDFPYMLKSSAIKILTSKNQHNLRFLFERLNSTRFEVLGHARHYISVVQNTTTLCPSIDEEVCISNLLTKFDELITLHQRKLDNLKLKKKALLQKLFPKNGDRYPELRFPGFTDAWEQRKFKDIAFKRGKISEADLPYIEFEDINSGIGTLNKNILQKVGHKKGILFEAGDVLFGKLRPYLQNWLLCQFMGIAVGDFWVFQPQIVSSAFLYYLIQSEAYQSVANISSGTKMPRSSWLLVSETQFSIPKYKEATMIGEFFTSIDKNITLHQRKLDHLQLQKKALLQQMFV